MPTIKIALVGLGKIARDQHMPALAANDAFELVAVAHIKDRAICPASKICRP
jgi:predicted dehydrogenase